MKYNKSKSIFPVFLIELGILLFSVTAFARGSDLSVDSADNQAIPSGCTVFTIAKGGHVFFGGNDDYINPDSYYWVDPGDSANYGVIWIGTPDNVQQGVSEKGLAYDANGLPKVDVNPHNEQIPVLGDYNIYPIRIMHECATVEEVITWIKTHQWHSYMHDQMQFADATGDAVIISAGTDGEVAFTRKPSGDGFLVSTNFNVVNPSNGFGYPCWRYDKAHELLGELLNSEGELTATDATNVLDAVHMEKGSSWTLESMVADLVNGVVYIYYFYQYDRPVVLNVKDELSNPREAGPLSSLFPDDVRQEAARRYNQEMATARTNQIVGISWTAIIFVSLILLFTISSDNKKGLKFWIPAVVVLGPLALLVKLLAAGNRKTDYRRIALIETTGDLIPVVAAFTIAFIILILVMMSHGISGLLQIVIMFGLPLFVSWLMFQGPILTSVSQRKFSMFLIQRLPQVIVVTLLGLSGIYAIALPLMNKSLAMSQIKPLSPWIVMTWWAIVVLGSLAGGLLVFLYERWAVKQGFQAWIILSGNEGEAVTPSWRRIWWWILISIMTLIIGLVTGVILLQMMAG
ncbi:MAG TPA: hypothetical protein VMW32_12045 [Bacteroidales bacterium]|nr:hypothetical protein [Bacteroidales bacterium]